MTPPAPPTHDRPPDHPTVHQILVHPDFLRLVRTRHRICWTLTALTLLIYYGFIYLLAFHKDVFGIKLTQNIPLGIPLGVGVIVASWLLTGIYVRWANRRYDAMVHHLKEEFFGHATHTDVPGKN